MVNAKRFNMRVSAETLEALDRICEAEQCTRAEAIRRLIEKADKRARRAR